MQGANAVLARHQGNMKKDQVSAVLVRHIKLSNVSLGMEEVFFANTDTKRYFTLLEK